MTRLGFFKWFWGAVYVRVLVYLYPVRTTIKKLKTQIGEWLLLHNII